MSAMMNTCILVTLLVEDKDTCINSLPSKSCVYLSTLALETPYWNDTRIIWGMSPVSKPPGAIGSSQHRHLGALQLTPGTHSSAIIADVRTAKSTILDTNLLSMVYLELEEVRCQCRIVGIT